MGEEFMGNTWGKRDLSNWTPIRLSILFENQVVLKKDVTRKKKFILKILGGIIKNNCAKYLRKRYDIDQTRILLHGHSSMAGATFKLQRNIWTYVIFLLTCTQIPPPQNINANDFHKLYMEVCETLRLRICKWYRSFLLNKSSIYKEMAHWAF